MRFHIKRFRWSGIKREKIHTQLTFPFVLDLTNVRGWGFCEDRDDGVNAAADTHETDESDSNGGAGKRRRGSRRGRAETVGASSGSSSASVSSGSGSGSASEDDGDGACVGAGAGAGSPLLDLTGIICHEGKGMSGGHYFSYCKHHPSGEWYLYNDHRVSRASLTEVQAAQASDNDGSFIHFVFG